MNRILALMLLSSFSVYAQDARPAEKPAGVDATEKTTLQKIADIKQGMNEKYGAFMKEVRAIKDRKDQQEFYQKNRPDFSTGRTKVLELIKADPTAKGVDRELAMFLGALEGEEQKEALDLMFKHHKGSDAMVALAQSMSRRPNKNDILTRIAAESTNAGAQAVAKFNLAKSGLANPETKATAIAEMKALLATPDLEKKHKRIFDNIKSELFVLEHLSIGSKAPEIVGRDQDDKEFKLSDYKGKVVLLDFWGYW